MFEWLSKVGSDCPAGLAWSRMAEYFHEVVGYPETAEDTDAAFRERKMEERKSRGDKRKSGY